MANRELQVGDEVEGRCSGWFNVGRGHGFISVDGIRKDIFVPARNLLNAASLEVGDTVTLEVRMGYDGKLMADNVGLVSLGS
jgi:cold shock CspA family protein